MEKEQRSEEEEESPTTSSSRGRGPEMGAKFGQKCRRRPKDEIKEEEEQWKKRPRMRRRRRITEGRLRGTIGTMLIMIILIITTWIGRGAGAETDQDKIEEKVIGPDPQLEGISVKRGGGVEVGVVGLIGRTTNNGTGEGEEEVDEENGVQQQRRKQMPARIPVQMFRRKWHYADFVYSVLAGAPAIQAHISRHSWERYQQFKEETCRKVAEADLAERRLNSTESAYFHWEENEFHRELRKKILPQTRDGSFRSLVASDLLGTMDPRLFASAPKSLCRAKRLVDEEDERQKLVKLEKHRFEDFLINKVLDLGLFAMPTVSRRANGTITGAARSKKSTTKTNGGGGL